MKQASSQGVVCGNGEGELEEDWKGEGRENMKQGTCLLGRYSAQTHCPLQL